MLFEDRLNARKKTRRLLSLRVTLGGKFVTPVQSKNQIGDSTLSRNRRAFLILRPILTRNADAVVLQSCLEILQHFWGNIERLG